MSLLAGKKQVLFSHTPKPPRLRGFVMSAIALSVSRHTARVLAVFFLLASPLFFLTRASTPAYAATNNTLNFQARLQSGAGAIAPDGYYNVEFKLYDASTGGTLLWTETRDYNGGAPDNRVRVANGYLSVNLGDITAFPSTMPWDQQLYLTMNIGGKTTVPSWDGEMSPRLKLTAVPYAFNAKQAESLNQVQGSYTGTLSFGTFTGAAGNQDFVIPDQGAPGTYTLLTGAAASGSYIQLQGSSPGTQQTGNFNISGTGIAGTLQAGTFDTASAGVLAIGTTNATNIQIGSNVTDATAHLFILDSYNGASDPTGYEGAMYYNTSTNTFRCYQNAAWADCIGSGGSGGANTALSNLASVAINTSLLPAADNTISLGDATHSWQYGYFGTKVYGPAFDTASATTLTIGGTATSISLGSDTVLAAGKSLTITGGITSTRPASPTDGMLYYDTSTHQLLVYNGSTSKWQADRSTATKIVAASDASQALKDSADYVLTGTGDQTIINSALTAAAGGKVYLTEGHYYLSAAISIPNGTTLAGAGTGTVITIPASQNGTYNMIQNTDTTTGTGVTIRDLKVDGNKSAQSSGSMMGIRLNGITGGVVTHVAVKSIYANAGINLNAASNITVSDSTVLDSGYGITLSGSSTNDNITNNVIQSNVNYGIYLVAGVSGNNITNNVSQGNAFGIYVNSSSNNNTISGNTTSGNSNIGIDIYSSSNNTVSGNTSSGNIYGFYIAGSSSYNTFIGNTAQGNTSYGIFSGSSNNNTITGNTTQGNGSGIYITSSSRDTITGNTASGNTTYGIYLTSSSNNAVSGNTAQSNGSIGIVIVTSSSNNISSNNMYDNGSATANNGIYLNTNSSSNTIVGNTITDTSCTSTCVAINIADAGSTGNYLADNVYSGDGTHTATINDAGTGTIYGGQADSSNNYVIQPAANIKLGANTDVTGSLSASTSVLAPSFDRASAGTLSIGTNATNTTAISIGSSGITTTVAGSLSITPQTSTSTTLLCSNAGVVSTCDSSVVAPTAANFIQNQNSAAQTTANFWISGSGRTDTSILTPLLDTASAGTLSIGTTNASTVNIATNAAAHTINIGTDATTAQTVAVGSTNTGSTTSLAAGGSALSLSNSGLSVTGNTTTSGTISTTAGGAAGTGTQLLASNLYIQSRGTNLVTNGTGLLGNNYNFSSFTFDPQNVYAGGGSFKNSTYAANVTSDELIPVDPTHTYQLTLSAESTVYVAGAHAYFGVTPYDIDGNVISPQMYSKYAGSTDTTLAAPLNPGDTTVTLTNAAGWYNGAGNYNSNFAWYGYTNGKGYTYPDYTYSRYDSYNYSSNGTLGAWGSGGISGNVITLRVPWAGPAIASGTAVRNSSSGGSYKYITAVNVNVPSTWATYSGRIGGIDTNGTMATNLFPYGTAYVKLLFLMNRDVTGNTTNVSGITFTDNSGVFGAATATTVPVIVQGAASQSADLLQLQNATGTVLSKFDSAGNLIITATGTSSFAGQVKAASLQASSLDTASAGTLSIGTNATNTTAISIGSSGITTTVAGSLSITPQTSTSTTLLCSNAGVVSTCDSSVVAPTAANFIQNQNSAAQTTANFWVDGTGRAATLQGDTLVGGSSQQFNVNTSGDVAFGGVADHTISIGAAGDGVNAANLVLKGGDGTTPVTAPAIVNSTISYVNNTNTVTASYPAGIQAGDIMIMVVGQAYTMTGTPAGWTMLSNNGGGSFVSGYTLSKTVTAGDVGGSTTVNFASPYYGEVSIIAVRHVSGVRNVYASQSTTGSTSETIGPVNVQAGDMIIYGGMVRLTNGDIGITTGTVQQKRNTDTSAGALLGYESAATTGTKSQTFTVNATPSGRYYALVSLIPAVSNGGSVVLSGGTATVGTGGNVTVKNALDVTDAFTVQNAAGTDQFIVDAANTRIGVGTSTPAYTIDATGSIRATTSVLTPTLDTASSVALNIGASSSAINLNQSTSLAAGKSLTFTAGGGNFDQSASTGTFKTSSGANTLGGNTTIASGKSLTVQGAATFQNATDSGSAFAINNAAGTSMFKVDTGNGRIGINNNSPAATLDVFGMGPAYVNGFESGALSPFTTATPGQWGVQTSAKARSGAYTLTGNYNGDGTVGTSYTTSLTKTLNAAGTISFYYSCDWSYNAVNPPIASFNVDGGTTNYLSDSAGNCNGSLSNGTTYAYASYAVGSGSHTFNFVYHMSTGSSPSSFRIRIDDLTISNVGTTGTAALFNNGGVGINLGTAVQPTAMLDVNGETRTSLLSVGGATSTTTFSLQGGMSTTQLSTPAAPTITNAGTAGTTGYSYTVTALDGTGETVASTAGTTATGNATLDATNYNTVTWTTVPGAVSYNVYRTATGGTPATTGYIGNVAQTTTGTASLNDTGLAGSGSAPAANTTGGIQGASSLSLGTASTTTGSITLHNSGSAYGVTLQAAAETVGNATITIPDTAGVADTICLQTLGNCSGAGASTVGAIDGGTYSANGASIASNTLYLQTASGTHVGLVNTGTQTFAGDKTFSGAFTVSASTSHTFNIGGMVQGNSCNSTFGLCSLNLSGYGTGTPTIDITNSTGASRIDINAQDTLAVTAVGGTSLTSTSTTGTALLANNTAASATVPTVIFRGGATPGAAADLLQLQNSSNAVLSGFNNAGDLYFKNGSTVTIQAAAQTGNYTLSIPALTANADICTSQGNCLGGSGGGANTALSNLASVAINTSLLPATTNSINLGSSTNNWANGYFGTSVYTPSIRPNSDSTTAFQVQNAAGSQTVLDVDTSNKRIGINTTPSAYTLEVNGTTQLGGVSSTGVFVINNSGSQPIFRVDSTNNKLNLQAAANATSFNPIYNATSLNFTGKYWNGTASTSQTFTIAQLLATSGINSRLGFLNNAGTEIITFNDDGTSNFTGQLTAASFQGASLDTASAGALNIGLASGGNATSINLNQSTVLAAGKSITLTGGNTASRPASPTDGMLYYDTSTHQLLVYNGGTSKWQADKTQAVLVAASNSSQVDKDAADYVATGTGDQATINSALTDADPAGTGKKSGKVYLFPGTYTIAAAISVPSNTTLTGAGNGSVITIPSSQNGSYNMVQDSGTGAIVRDLMVDGNSSAQASGSMQGIYLSSTGGKVINVNVKNIYGTTSYGIKLSSTGITASGNTVTGTMGGVWAGSNNVISDNIVQNNISYGIVLASNDTVSGNTVTGTTTGTACLGVLGATACGMYISGSYNTLTANTVQGNTNGIMLYDSLTNNTIAGNTVNGNTNYGIGLVTYGSASNNNITGNTVQGNGYGIYLDASWNGPANSLLTNISGNTVSGNTSAGIYLLDASKNVVNGNTVYSNGGSAANAGIVVSSGNYNTVTNNRIEDSSCTGSCVAISVSGTSNSLSGNTFTGDGTHTATISDTGTSTVYAGQTDSSGNYVIQPASGAANLTSRSGTTSSNVIIGTGNASAGASGNITIDTGTATTTAGTISIGTSNASAITIASSGVATTVQGQLIANGPLTMTNNLTGSSSYRTYLGGTFTSSVTTSQYGIQNQMNFNPNGGSLSNLYGFINLPTISGSNYNITNAYAGYNRIDTTSGFTGQIGSAYGLRIDSPSLGGTPSGGDTRKVLNYYGAMINGTSNGGNTNGTVTNYGLNIQGNTATAGAGGTVNNYSAYIQLGTGGSTGTTSNYGLYLTGNGGTATTNWMIYNTSTAPNYIQGNTSIGTTSNPNGYALNVSGTIGGSSSLTLGTAGPSGTNGSIVLKNASNANTVTVLPGATSTSYSLTLPTATGTTGQCLYSTDNASTLGWTSCSGGGGGGVTLQGSSPGAADTGNFNVSGVGIAGTALASPALRPTSDGTTALQIQNTAGTTTIMNVDTTNSAVTFQAGSDTSTVGAELYPTNNFATDWTNTGWDVTTSSRAIHNVGNTSVLQNNTVAITAGATYQVGFTIAYSCGATTESVTATLGGQTLGGGPVYGTGGTCDASPVYVVTATNTNKLAFTPSSSWNGGIRYVSIKQISNPVKSALQVDNTSSTANIQVRASNDVSNLFVGLQSGQFNSTSTGVSNTALGTYSLQSNTIGYANTAVGYNSLQGNTSGYNNTAIGSSALQHNSNGYSNTALGNKALQNNLAGYNNIAIGDTALQSNYNGNSNLAIGFGALQASTTGGDNIAIGESSLIDNTSGGTNVAIGTQTLNGITLGTNNVAIGYRAGYITGSSFQAPSNLTNAVAIGANSVVYQSSSIALGGVTTSAAKVGIGTGMPSNTLSVEPFSTSYVRVNTTSSSTTVTAGTFTTFTASMVGKRLYIGSGVTNAAPYVGTVTAYNSSTSITVSPSVSFTGTNVAAYTNYTGLQVATNGQVGIGTASPSYQLDVSDIQASTYVARIANGDTGVNADGLLIDLGVANASRGTGNYFIGFSGAGTVAGKIQGGASAVAYTTSGADYAEYFSADQNNLPQAGELVALNQAQNQSVLLSGGNAQAPLAGIVSTSPGFIGNGPICKVDDKNCDQDYAKYNSLVALSGQVPAKVNTTHGAIAIGDPIAASSVAGEGAKATQSGYIVGYALEPLTSGSGTIKVLVRPQYYTVDVTQQLQGTIQIATGVNVAGPLSVQSDLSVSGDVAILGSLSTQDIHVTNLVASGNITVSGNLTVAGNVTIAGTVQTGDIYVNGHIVTKGSVPTVAAGEALGRGVLGLSTSAPAVTNDGTDAAGTVIVTAGAQNVTSGVLAHVTFAQAFGQSYKVVASASNDNAAMLHVYVMKTTDGFDIVSHDPVVAGTQYSFDYIVLGATQ